MEDYVEIEVPTKLLENIKEDHNDFCIKAIKKFVYGQLQV